MTPLLIQALVFGGCGLAVGIIVGLVLGWRARRNVARDLAQDVVTFRAEMAAAEGYAEADLRNTPRLAPKVVRQ